MACEGISWSTEEFKLQFCFCTAACPGILKAQMWIACKNSEYFRVCLENDWVGMISLL